MKPIKYKHSRQSYQPDKPANETTHSSFDDQILETDTFKRLLAQYKARVYEQYAKAF